MANQICGECAKLDLNNKERYSSKNKYWCRELHKYMEMTDRSCRYYLYEPSRNSKPSSECYITTIVCEILGHSDNCDVLNTLRNFRENYLRVHPEYLNLLLEYDFIGPKVASNIRNLKDNHKLCEELFEYFLLPISWAIKINNYEDAIETYKTMVLSLTERFNIPVIKSYDISNYTEEELLNVGKGRIRKIEA